MKKVLNACIRFIFNLPVYSHFPLLPYYKKCHILPIAFRIMFQIYMIVYKSINNIAPAYLSTMFHMYGPKHCPNLRKI